MGADDNRGMTTPIQIDGGVPLTHWGVIRAHGADASSFLQSQLTNDVTLLGQTQARLAGFCSAKGRLQASFTLWKTAPDEVLLACAASVLPATLKRLSMFVLRARCKLSDASADVPLQGIAGSTARERLGDQSVWEVRASQGMTLLRLPDAAGLPRALLPGPVSSDTLPPPITLDAWRWLEVRSGVPTIEAATAEQFVPQMLNYELVGGVDFSKGCYPGQEVVARSQYRGTIKRRMFLFDCDDALAAAGQEVFHSADAGQPAGMVVNAAPLPGGSGASALVEVKLAALSSGSLHLGAAGGPVLRRAELPYAVPLDVAAATA